MPIGSAESLRHSYKSGLTHLVEDYTAYLRRNIHETAALGPEKRRTRTSGASRKTKTFSRTNETCSSNSDFNENLVSPSTPTAKMNETTTPNVAANISRVCKTGGFAKDFGHNVPNFNDRNAVSSKRLNSSAGFISDGDPGIRGLLVIEPLVNVSHNVQHHQCESPAIQEALVTRIVSALDMERNINFFRYSKKVFRSLIRQRDVFEL